MSSRNSETVRKYLSLIEHGRFDDLKEVLHDGFTFVGPLESAKDAEQFINLLKSHLTDVIERVEVKKLFVDGDEVCALYDFVTRTPAGTVAMAESFRLEDGLVKTVKLIYDARPFVAMLEKDKRGFDILHRAELNAPPAHVFAALTETRGLAGWWTLDVRGESQMGGSIDFHFGDWGKTTMRVEEVVENKRVRWTCTAGNDEWIGTDVVWSIEETNEGSVLRFSHKNWREKTDMMGLCSTHWASYIISLKALLEEGRGTPFPNQRKI